MESLELFFRNNMDYVFLVYGFAFIFMGVSIAIQPRSDSQLTLARNIWLLSMFAFLHGINEWIDMMVFTHPLQDGLKTASFIFCITSFCFLFEFGRNSVKSCAGASIGRYFRYLGWWLMPLVLVLVLIFAFSSGQWLRTGQILSRYFLAFPGAVMTAAGLLLYRRETNIVESSRHDKYDKYFVAAATLFLLYGFFAGVVVPKGGIFPSNIINAENFLSLVHIPVQVFRAIAALVIAFSILGIIKLFNYEARGKLEVTIQQLYKREADIIQSSKKQKVINSILEESLLPAPIEELCENILELLMSISWIHLQRKGCIFLADEESGGLKIVASHNFSDEQVASCSPLPYGKCLCGLAAATRELVFSQDNKEEAHSIRYKHMFPHGHYCVPIISADRLLGVINVYLNVGYERKNEDEVFLKSVARTIAGVILRKEAETKMNQNFLIQNVINTVLQLSIKSFSLKEYLEKILELISTVPWLSTKTTGCIFLIENGNDELEMVVHRGISPLLLKTCKRVPMGSCLCGRCAHTGKVIFTSTIDDKHEVTYGGMHNHGHYCIPIKSKEKVVGVINLYVEAGHTRTALEEGFLVSVANTLSGIVERKRMEERLEYLANNDALTGLPNRVLFIERLRHEIKSGTRYGHMLGVLYIDIDNFKIVNDTMGHDIGDLLIKSIAGRLSRCIRESDTVSRMSGDEFTVILSNLKDTGHIEAITNKLLTCLNEPYEVNRKSYSVTASIGISVFPSDAATAGDLLKHADTAMYHAKNTGKNSYVFFNSEMDESLNKRLTLEKELRLAIERDELIMHYQPQIDIKSGRIVGAEALVRWQHPERGLIFPDKFITLAEDAGIMIPLGEQVLYKSCKQNTEWQSAELPPIVVAVNVSTTQISGHYNLADIAFGVLNKTGMASTHLEIEITESFCMQNVDSTISMLRRFNSRGINVSIDDFGTGYSSLSYLKYLPFKKLKIDRSFIKEITKNHDDLTIVKTIIDMSHNLRLKVIAEGVETSEQLEILRTLGCDEVQGYLFSRPLPAEDFAELLKEEYYCPVGN
ncbi:MAG: EAL domain-containing protein [Nitrospirae bacterium]|nr:EAL domain-containing protein [Nitrospirota bacterium]